MPWTRFEVEALVADYLEMLWYELQGKPFNKAERNRKLQSMTGRSHGSIERKHQNVSAILTESGRPYVEGYKPLSNYQQLLAEVVSEQLAAQPKLDELLEKVVQAEETKIRMPKDLLSLFVAPPEAPAPRKFDETPSLIPVGTRNYLEIEARNHSLGRAGEHLVLKLEHERLWQAGEKTLADRIEHVSETKGDGLGYDILSFETDGREKLIEVKTTRFGALTPFFASRNEVEFSERCANVFHLYRVHRFSKSPKVFALAGSLRKTCQLEAESYRARVA